MQIDSPVEPRLTQLNLDIEQLEAELRELEKQRGAAAKQAGRATRQFRYLRFVRRLRSPAANWEFWPTAVLLVGSLVVGIVTFIATDLVLGSFPLALLALVIGLAGGAAMFAALLHRPADGLLPAAISNAEQQAHVADTRLREVLDQLALAKQRLNELLTERREQIASGKLQRAALLQREWKTMVDDEWEDFVVEVCRTLGATVNRARRTNEPDANLIAEFGKRRVAILTRGEGKLLDSDAVKQALAGRERHRSAACAVIVNRRFTGAAQHFAQRNDCTLIGSEEFPDFVMGKIEL